MVNQPSFKDREAAKALMDARFNVEAARRRFDGRSKVGKAVRELEAHARKVEDFVWQQIYASQVNQEKGQTGESENPASAG